MRLFPTATCFHSADKSLPCCMLHSQFLSRFLFTFVYLISCYLMCHCLALGFSFIMTKRDSCLAGITSPRAPMSMPRRHSRLQGQSSSGATSSGSRPQPSSVTDNLALPSLPGIDHSGSSPHFGYTATTQSAPLPDAPAHQNPIQPVREEAYPLLTEIEQQNRTLHTHIFTEVRSHQTGVSRLMVTEVDRYGVQHNRQPEFFFNGIVGHIRADRYGWIDSWEQSTQLANYWRRHFNIPEEHHEQHSWQQYPQVSDNADQPEESQESLPGSEMDDTDSITANAGAASVPSQIHQLAAVLWDILNNDRESNAAILEKLENPGDDLSTNPVQVFTAADLAHLASHVAQTTHVLSQQAQHMEELSDIDD